MPARQLSFVHQNALVTLSDVHPNETVLDYLRLRAGLRGTKEGCAEGDCGACTVVLGTTCDGALRYEPVNSCICLLGTLHGKVLVTVEDLGTGEALHPVQQALVMHHGAQCGFCTPGFVMSLFALYHDDAPADRARINDALAGNLCRCTGYRPIVDAALASCADTPSERTSTHDAAALMGMLRDVSRTEDLYLGDEVKFFAAPASLQSLTTLSAAHPDATVLAGGTDVGLWITKALREMPKVIYLGRVEELQELERREDALRLGAGVTYAQAEPALAEFGPDVSELLKRLGSRQVRALGTIAGNIANGSPIGDMPPLLIALGAQIELRFGAESRCIELEAFFLEYGRQDRRDGEILTHVIIPRLRSAQRLYCYKLSKRFDQDISAVMGAFCFTLDNGRITHARIAYGGMAPIPRRALKTESALIGRDVTRSATTHELTPDPVLAESLAADFQPIDDLRASAVYRAQAALALLHKAMLEAAQIPREALRLSGCAAAGVGPAAEHGRRDE